VGLQNAARKDWQRAEGQRSPAWNRTRQMPVSAIASLCPFRNRDPGLKAGNVLETIRQGLVPRLRLNRLKHHERKIREERAHVKRGNILVTTACRENTL